MLLYNFHENPWAPGPPEEKNTPPGTNIWPRAAGGGKIFVRFFFPGGVGPGVYQQKLHKLIKFHEKLINMGPGALNTSP